MAQDGTVLNEDDMEKSLKIIVVGNGQVGKTSMATRYAKGVMTEQYKKTIGTDFMEKDIKVKNGDSVKLMIWDTAGQEMFSQLTKQYYRGAGAVIYVFSTVDRESFNEVERWKSKVTTECGDQIASVLVQNKIDLLDKAEMKPGEVEDLAKRMGVKLYRVCVKDNIQVDDVFDYLTDSWLKKGGDDGEALPDIKQFNSKNSSTDAPKSPSDSKNDENGGNSPANAGNGSGSKPESPQSGSSGSSEASDQPGGNKSFQLNNAAPSKQRTGGKKRPKCIIM